MKAIAAIVLLLAACTRAQQISEDIYERQLSAVTFEGAGRSGAAAAQRRRIAKEQDTLERMERDVPSWHYPQ